MTLYKKIITIYPELESHDFSRGSILLENSGNEDYIAKWDHPTLPRPTEEQLNGA